MIEPCTLCGGADLPAAYVPQGTARGLTVHYCAACGLVQSLPRRASGPKQSARISGGADWGNVRYGKAFRVADTMAALQASLAGRAPRRILDIGSNRGAFLAAARAAWPSAAMIAVEPDDRVVGDYRDWANLTLHCAPIESVSLPTDGIDLVHCSHTLEHLADPFAVLTMIAETMAPDGVAYLEVPNVETITRADLVEEWFIDKHLYHFGPDSFAAGLAKAGLAPIGGVTGGLHLAATVRRRDAWSVPARADATWVAGAISAYAAQLADNQAKLTLAAKRIADLGDQAKVAIWGAGRILDSLVRVGGLDPARLAMVVDRHLVAHADVLHGAALRAPDALRSSGIDTVIVASREFADQIAQEAVALVPNARVIRFAELLQPACDPTATATMH